jgi:homoserine kinase
VGVGLGSSACSCAVALAVDVLFGGNIRREDERLNRQGKPRRSQILDLMLSGEGAVSGGHFYDNLAPLLFGGLVFIREHDNAVSIEKLKWPSGISIATITPNLSLSTADMRKLLVGRRPRLEDAVSEINRKIEVVRGIETNDFERVIENSFGNLVERYRWDKIPAADAILAHIAKRREEGHCISVGIAGSGPTLYCVGDSEAVVEQTGEEIRELWKKKTVDSVKLLHFVESDGAKVVASA